jgi:fructose/tagatose bisphosphate aldolase
MALVHKRGMLQHAYRNQYAVAAFDLVSPDFLAVSIGTVHSRLKDEPKLDFELPHELKLTAHN